MPHENTTAPHQPHDANSLPAAAAGRWPLGGDLPVRRMGFGAMRLPGRTWEGPAGDPEAAVAVLRRAVELGVDHIDTAAFYFYKDLSANAFIRRALHPYPDDLVIATKVGPDRSPDHDWLDAAGPAKLKADVHRNLRQLGVDRLDLVYLRFLSKDGPGDGRFEALAELREEGLIRHLGVSNATAAQLAEAQRIAPVAAVQNRYSPVSRDAEADALVELCARQGIAFVPFFPLGGAGAPHIAALREVAARHGASAAQVGLAWSLSVSPAVLAIPGTSSLAHLEENVAAAALTLDAEDLATLTAG
ncbi:oxidoreductase [Streptomyces spectabilis]|uniref:Oxidoreductase n=1 Tax=Streptomyces spectabilis TaxID=68270 RepID=A0A5P2XIF2_STRST|nr:oxidoreductase [Streptomyces spectabilis]MBB5105232.1 aryl-alcohol dehydrogenase-like predicted oxidoreductase [Streptomyces spectabilis]QEV62865.1 oxidoreductase [Streptomyces spectabilis]GGV05681.1 oxidoreductase [Streptomyces spectabilis]